MPESLSNLFSDEAVGLRARVIGIYALLIGANVAAWLWALSAFRNYPILLGTAMLAYTFGLRHAFDADHIAAIDNVTRKLMQEGKRPVAVGFFFSLGHSTIVVLLSIAIAVTATALQSRFDAFTNVGGVVGALVSAFFLFAIAAANILVLMSICRTFHSVKNGGKFVEEDLDLMLAQRGFTGACPAPLLSPDRAELAHVSARPAVRSWLRHRDRSGSARNLGDTGRAGHVDLVDSGVSGAVHSRDVVDGYDRQRADARRLWLGVPEADPQALLQPDRLQPCPSSSPSS